MRRMRSCTATNCSPMMWRFSSGSTTPSRAPRNWSPASSTMKLSLPSGLEEVADEGRLALPHQAGIDIKAADAILFQAPVRHNVKATVESTPPLTKKNTLRSPTTSRIRCFDQRDAVPGIPVVLASADIEEEVREDLPAVPGVNDFRVELNAVKAAGVVGHGGNGAGFGRAEHSESGGQAPRPCRGGSSRSAARPGRSGTGWTPSSRSKVACPYSPLSPLRTFAAEQVRHQLLAVADPENGGSGEKTRRIDGGAAGLVNAGRATRDDNPRRPVVRKQGFRSAGPRHKRRVREPCGR